MRGEVKNSFAGQCSLAARSYSQTVTNRFHYFTSGSKKFMSSRLFTPIELSGLQLANRVVVAPMCQYSANEGTMSDWHLAHLGQFAMTGPGLIIIEATGVEAVGRITHGCCGLYSDENEAAMKRVISFCKSVGDSKIGIQLGHAGRKASTERPWEGGNALKSDAWQTCAPSAIAFTDGWHTLKLLKTMAWLALNKHLLMQHSVLFAWELRRSKYTGAWLLIASVFVTNQ